jgi:hypothetical protein
VVSLQSLGVVNIGGTDVSECDALLSVLANVSEAEQSKSFTVKRGNELVNEYTRTNSEGEQTDGGLDNTNHLLGALPMLYCYGTWEISDLPEGANLVGSKWVFHIKKDTTSCVVRYKAQLVVQGFSQVKGVDYFDTYTPVAKLWQRGHQS